MYWSYTSVACFLFFPSQGEYMRGTLMLWEFYLSQSFCFFYTCIHFMFCHLTSIFMVQPLADAEGAKKHGMIELLKSYGGLSYVSFTFSKNDFSFSSSLLKSNGSVKICQFFLLSQCFCSLFLVSVLSILCLPFLHFWLVKSLHFDFWFGWIGGGGAA